MEEPAISHAPRAVVSMQHIGKSFGANRVLSDISFEVRAGETHALLGENGAGKSTLMKILVGAHGADEGRIDLDGEDVTTQSLRERLDRGVAMIFQELSLLPNRSVAENLFVLREPRSFGLRVDVARMLRDAGALIDRFGFPLDAQARVGELGFAQRQMVEILKGVSRGAKLLILDEPTSSLTIREEETLFRTLAQLKSEGIGLVYISHRMADVLRVSDRISIIKDGRLVGPLDPRATSIEEIAALMSRPSEGGARSPGALRGPARRAADGRPAALEAHRLTTARKLSGVDLSIGAGEIVGLAGLVGSGRSTIAKALFGIIPDARGVVRVAGAALRLGDVRQAAAAGVGLVPEDRRLEGLIDERSLAENIALPNLAALTHGGRFGPVASRRVAQLFRRYRDQLGVICRGPGQIARELSGGNQQKIVFAKWLAMNPKLLLLDEPTAGVDINAKRDMRDLIRNAAAAGVGVLLISSELEELMELSDRILVIAEGRITRALERVEDEAALRALLQAEAAGQAAARGSEAYA